MCSYACCSCDGKPQGRKKHQNKAVHWMCLACTPPPPPHPTPRANIFLISPPGGGVPGGSDPTVDTLALPLIPTLWYYLVAAGGALILLAVAILVRALCCHRRRLAAKKSQLSVAYHSQSQYFQYSQCSASNPVTAAPGTEPVLTVRLDNHGQQTYALC